jgi:hypothetical protein
MLNEFKMLRLQQSADAHRRPPVPLLRRAPEDGFAGTCGLKAGTEEDVADEDVRVALGARARGGVACASDEPNKLRVGWA